MYQNLLNINRAFALFSALGLLLGFIFPPFGATLGLDTRSGIMIFTSIFAGSVLLDRRLATLAFHEALSNTPMDKDLDVVEREYFEQRRKEKLDNLKK